MIRKRIKHTKRYQEIINSFIMNGFSHVLYRIGLTRKGSSNKKDETSLTMNNKNIGLQLRHTFQQLGPTFIKLGQIASSRRDLIPKEITTELEKLQDDVTPVAYEKIKETVEFELDDSIENLFTSFNKKPLATASIGQVHVAQLASGEEVAIKVQRPDIEKKIKTDLEILHDLAQLLENNFEWAKRFQLSLMIEEYGSSLLNELNYVMEGNNGKRIAKQFSHQKQIHIPKVYSRYSSNKVLTMEMIRGIKVSELELLKKEQYNLSLIAKRLTDAMLQQVLIEGFFHGDPHSGNIFILPNNTVTFLDFGMVGQLSNSLKYHFSSLIIHMNQKNSEGIIDTFNAMEILEENTNINQLTRDLDHLFIKYYDVNLKNMSLGRVISEILAIARKHQIKLPSDITILGKVIITLESIIEQLDPTFSVMNAVEPFGKKLIKERFHPKNIIKRYSKELINNIKIISNLPKDIQGIATTIQKGKVRLDIKVLDLKDFLLRLDKISNRLSFSVILLAFSILMSGLIIGASISGQTALLWRLPVIEVGAIVATAMFLFMLFSIFRSGRM